MRQRVPHEPSPRPKFIRNSRTDCPGWSASPSASAACRRTAARAAPPAGRARAGSRPWRPRAPARRWRRPARSPRNMLRGNWSSRMMSARHDPRRRAATRRARRPAPTSQSAPQRSRIVGVERLVGAVPALRADLVEPEVAASPPPVAVHRSSPVREQQSFTDAAANGKPLSRARPPRRRARSPPPAPPRAPPARPAAAPAHRTRSRRRRRPLGRALERIEGDQREERSRYRRR